jgi:hypothetical protein
MDSEITEYDYGDDKVYEIPRVRMCSSLRKDDSSRFICNSVTFTMEQGSDPSNVSNMNPSEIPKVDMSVSKNGGRNFSSYSAKFLNHSGIGPNRIIWWGIGASNDLIFQFRFFGFGRFVLSQGKASIYQ